MTMSLAIVPGVQALNLRENYSLAVNWLQDYRCIICVVAGWEPNANGLTRGARSAPRISDCQPAAPCTEENDPTATNTYYLSGLKKKPALKVSSLPSAKQNQPARHKHAYAYEHPLRSVWKSTKTKSKGEEKARGLGGGERCFATHAVAKACTSRPCTKTKELPSCAVFVSCGALFLSFIRF